MTHTFITRNFFDPILDGTGPVETTSYSWRFLHNCDLRGLILSAMETLRIQGALTPIPNVEHRDFIEAHAYNRFIEVGLDSLDNNDRFAAASLIADPLCEMIQTYMSKYIDRAGNTIDEVGFRKNLHRIVRRVNDFLNHPKLHTLKWRRPRSTGYDDRAFLHATGIPINYLVRFDGWQPTIFERVNHEDWAEAQPLDNPLRAA